MQVSIIIPTFDNVEYIDECLMSIINSAKDFEFEVLVGIDNCLKTSEYLVDRNYPEKINFFFFEKNVGPYIVKNSLAKESKFNNLVFFDSDDIMDKEFIPKILNYLKIYDCVKPKLQNFVKEDNNVLAKHNKISWGEGVFGIKKNLFLEMNGFEPWICAADSDFIRRLHKNKKRVLDTLEILMFRRIHSKGLTSKPETNFSSKIRSYYGRLLNSKKYFGPLPELKTENFVSINDNINFGGSQQDYDFIDYEKQIKDRKINTVFNRQPRKIVEHNIIKKQNPVILDRLDFLYNNKSEQPIIIKTNKPDSRQELINKKNGTTKNTIKEMFNIKPNHRDGKNFINIGGKF